MPWYLTLVLFLLAPVYTIAVRDKVWPKVQDWWAGRSIRALERQIARLENRIKRSPSISAFLVFMAKRIFLILIFVTADVLVLSPLTINVIPFIQSGFTVSPVLQSYLVSDWVRLLLYLMLTLPLSIATVSYRQAKRYFPPTQEDWLKYKASVEARITALECELLNKSKLISAHADK